MSRENYNILSKQVLFRYALLQIPGALFIILLSIILYKTSLLSTPLIVLVILIWIAKDILLYPILWRAYAPGGQNEIHSMIGVTGMTTEMLSKEGYVLIRGELWHARIVDESEPIGKNEPVRVCGIEGLTLIVEPEIG